MFNPPTDVVNGSVINTFKSMIVDDDVLEKDDMYILNRMKDFTSNEEVLRLPAAKQLNILIERSVCCPILFLHVYLSFVLCSNEEAMP